MLTTNAILWAAARGLSISTLVAFGVDSDTTWVGQAEQEAIVFPYRRGSKLVNAKMRSLAGKDWRQIKDPELRFWNLDAVLSRIGRQEAIYICEGEMDAMAMYEAGIPQDCILSVPNGAPTASSENPIAQDRYKYVERALDEGLKRGTKFVLAVDSDGPGRALRQDLVFLFGAARCWFVDWPVGVKDANEYLLKFGAEDLRMFLTEAPREWPVAGLYRLSDLPENPAFELWKPGFPEWENKLQFAAKTVSVVTGFPGSGKTQLMMQLWFQILRTYGLAAAIASFETRPKPHHRRNITQFMYGRPIAEINAEERAAADAWIEERIMWIVHPNRKASLKWLLDTAEVAVIRNGCRVIQLDPWNKVESERPSGQTETDYIGECLDACLDFSNDMNCHLQIVAHPAKPGDLQARKSAPQLYDVAGSSHWFNKVDIGLSVHRPKVFENGERRTECDLHVLKAKYEELGYNCQLALDYRLAERRYVPIDYASRMDLM